MNILENPVIYITKDRERAEGMPEGQGYSIISGNGNQDTLELIKSSDISPGSKILVFKNSMQIEDAAKEKALQLLNPSAALAEKIENKITQVEWLGTLAEFLPEHHLVITKKITIEKPFILQWAHSHTGGGTLHIQKENELGNIQKQFPDREARVTKYIKGPMFTMNIVATKEMILLGNISYQITGIAPFTENPMSTIGNDWSVPQSILTEAHIVKFKSMANQIAKKMQNDGWRGLFGIDVIYDEERDDLFLIEINARQPASTTFESQLQAEAREKGVSGITIFEAHLLALLDMPINSEIIEINDGAQIIQRVTEKVKNVDMEKLLDAGYNLIEYNNTKVNSDLFRIQSRKGIMEAHNKFNARGKEIEALVVCRT